MRARLAEPMVDLPPDFLVPTPPPSAPRLPLRVKVAAWILVVAGVITGLGGALLLALAGAGSPERAQGAAYLAFGAAELLTGGLLLRMWTSFRSIGVALSIVGIAIDVKGLIDGSRWQIVALIAHAFAAYVLATSANAFGRHDRGRAEGAG